MELVCRREDLAVFLETELDAAWDPGSAFLREIGNGKQRGQRLAAWSLLERGLRETCGIESLDELDIRRDERGKPYSSARPELAFNISHCPAACACAIAARDVGIDVERKFGYKKGLARKVCHPEEWRRMEGLKETGEQEAFLRLLWSAKESIVKMSGEGLGYGLDRLNLLPLFLEETEACRKIGEKSGGIFAGEVGGIGRIWMLLQSREAFTLAVCVRERDKAEPENR